MKISLIHPSLFKLDGGAMFGIIPKPVWEKKIKADSQNRIEMSLRVVLIETQNKKILIDTGIGDYHSEKFNDQFGITVTKEPLKDALKNTSLQCEDITDVILTHLHFDHVGGLGDSEKPLFKNATIHVHEKHYEYALSPTLRDSGSFHSFNFKPLLESYKKNGQLNFISQNEGVIIDDQGEKVEFMTSFGHTPYMIHPIFNNFIYMADLVPMSHHIRLPWVMGYDIEPGTTTIYKEKFYNVILKRDLTMIFEHDVDTWGGKLMINEKGQYQLKNPQSSKKHKIELLQE